MLKRFFFGIVLCSFVMAAAQTKAPSDQYQEQLTELNKKFQTVCNTFFTPALFSKECCNRFDRFVWSWEKKYQQAQALPNQKQLFGLYLEYLQHIYLKLLPLSIGQHECATALVTNPLSTSEFQNLLLMCYEKLEQWLDQAWQTPDQNSKALSNAELTNITRQVLPSALIGNRFKRIGGITRAAKIYRALETNWFLLSSSFAQKYIAFVATRKQECYNHNALTALSLNALIELGEEVIKTTQDARAAQLVDIVLAHVRTIKQDMAYAQQLELLVDTPIKRILFIKHSIMIHDPLFQTIEHHLAAQEVATVAQYLKLVDYYLNTEKITTSLFFGELETTLEQLKNMQATTGPSVPQFVQKLHTTIQRFLIFFLYSPSPCGDHISTMITILEDIKKDFAPAAQQQNNDPIASALAWLNGTAATKDKFGDIKSAVFFAAAAASPFLLPKIFKLILPYLSDDLQQQLKPFVGEDKPDQDKQKKLLDFASKNPDLIKQLIQNNPEILDLIAAELKTMIKPQG